MGFISGNIACLGIVSLNVAFTNGGPAGPVTAISAMSSPSVVVLMAIWDRKMISPLELIGVIFGMYGALIISNPQFFELNCFCCCITRKIRTESYD